MCCQCESHHARWGLCAPRHNSCCFMTQGEKVSRLEQVLECLREEAKAVEARIAKLKEEP